MKNIHYREATLTDIDQLAKLRWEFRTEADEINPILIREDFEVDCRSFLAAGLSTTWAYWIAEEAGRIVSHAFVNRVAKIPNPDRIRDELGYVTNCYTIPSHRGKGIGAALMNALISWAKSKDLELLIVWPSDESVNYYQRLGFTPKNDIMQLSFR